MPRPPNQQSVSYGDVMTAADEVERAHHCHVHFQWFMNNQKGGKWVWSLRVVALWKGARSEITHERGHSMEWPNVDHRTPASAMLSLIYKLDWSLTEEEDRAEIAKEAQARFA